MPLSVPKNTQDGWANDINNLGHIVGQLDIYKLKGFVDGPGNYHPYLWKDGDMIDLEKTGRPRRLGPTVGVRLRSTTPGSSPATAAPTSNVAGF